MHIFYTPDINNSNEYILDEEESKHCVRVLRLKKNDEIILVDGKGGLYKASIKNAHDKKCVVEITSTKKDNSKKKFYLHIAIAPTKNIERFEWFLEKATEIGIDEITPLICEHSERTVIKTERLNKVIISAMKQSSKTWLPKLNEAIKYLDFLKNNFEGQKFIAHCRNITYNENLDGKSHLKNIYNSGKNVLVLIGPEGDFSESEVLHALNSNFAETILSNSRLRTETAGIAACQIVNLSNTI